MPVGGRGNPARGGSGCTASTGGVSGRQRGVTMPTTASTVLEEAPRVQVCTGVTVAAGRAPGPNDTTRTHWHSESRLGRRNSLRLGGTINLKGHWQAAAAAAAAASTKDGRGIIVVEYNHSADRRRSWTTGHFCISVRWDGTVTCVSRRGRGRGSTAIELEAKWVPPCQWVTVGVGDQPQPSGDFKFGSGGYTTRNKQLEAPTFKFTSNHGPRRRQPE
jgi:hypothetical protein